MAPQNPANWWIAQLNDALRRFIKRFEHSPEAAVGLIRGCLVFAASCAINENVEVADFLTMARMSFDYAMKQRKEVDAEDGN